MQTFRKWMGGFAVCCGILAALSALLLVPQQLGLCSWTDWGCQKSYEDVGKLIFTPAFLIFLLGTIVFVHTQKDRQPWGASIVVLIFGTLIYFAEDNSGGGWGLPDISIRSVLALLLALVYGAYILGLMLKELFGKYFSLIRNVKIKNLSTVILGIIITAWIVLETFWL